MNLEFNIQKCAFPVAGKNVLQLWERSQPLDRRLCDLDAVNLRLVAHDRFPVSSEPHVELEAVAAVGQSPVERCNGIFRNRLQGAGAAVTKKKRARGRARVIHARAKSVEIEISNRLAGVGAFFRPLHGLLKLLLEQV